MPHSMPVARPRAPAPAPAAQPPPLSPASCSSGVPGARTSHTAVVVSWLPAATRFVGHSRLDSQRARSVHMSTAGMTDAAWRLQAVLGAE